MREMPSQVMQKERGGMEGVKALNLLYYHYQYNYDYD